MSDNTTNTRNRAMGLTSHILVIVLFFILPEVAMTIAMPHRHSFGINPIFYIKALVYIAVFYLNYFWIIERTLAASSSPWRIPKFLGYNILIIVVGLICCYFASKMLMPEHRTPRHIPHQEPSVWHEFWKMSAFLLRDFVMMSLTVALAVALRLSAKWKDMQQQRQELLAAQRASELDSLKRQLNPHFLFNTLNTIYALTAIDSTKAQNAIHQLSALLRYVLYEDAGTVPLKRECQFVTDYISLMRLRVADREIDVKIDMGDYAEAQVPSLLFISLVENACKYGLTAPDKVPVTIEIKADGGRLHCITTNSVVRGEEHDTDTKNSGIGLANLRRRLTLIYGSEASLCTSTDGNMFTAKLSVPL